MDVEIMSNAVSRSMSDGMPFSGDTRGSCDSPLPEIFEKKSINQSCLCCQGCTVIPNPSCQSALRANASLVMESFSIGSGSISQEDISHDVARRAIGEYGSVDGDVALEDACKCTFFFIGWCAKVLHLIKISSNNEGVKKYLLTHVRVTSVVPSMNWPADSV